jgi:hypothetical protein
VDANKSEVWVGSKKDGFTSRWLEWMRVDQEFSVDVSWAAKRMDG